MNNHGPATGSANPEDTVRAFLTALERFDIDAAGDLLDPDVVYENVSLPAAHGRAATLRIERRDRGVWLDCHET